MKTKHIYWQCPKCLRTTESRAGIKAICSPCSVEMKRVKHLIEDPWSRVKRIKEFFEKEKISISADIEHPPYELSVSCGALFNNKGDMLAEYVEFLMPNE